MKLVSNIPEYEYTIKLLLRLFFPNETIEMSNTVENRDNTLKVIIRDDLFIVKYYTNGILSQEDSIKRAIYITRIHPVEIKKQAKILLKNLIYKVLSNATNIEQPWGILTGVRPTKIVFKLIEVHGMDYIKIRDILKHDYQISDTKVDLMLDIVKKEIPILAKNKPREVSIYIGIPFCPSRCLYCSFTSYPLDKWKLKIGYYLQALKKEIKYVAKKLSDGYSIRTIYIGGGTPTSLNAGELEYLLSMISNYFDIECVEEFTIEAGRPDTIDNQKLIIIKNYGLNRISINPQTMNQTTLDRIGREHSVEQIYDTYNMARELGFDNINMDIILGLPGETIEEVKQTIDKIKKLSPDSLTVHTMAIKRASKLMEKSSDYELLDSSQIEEMINFVYKELKDIDMHPYYMYRQKNMVGNFENVGYSKAGKECIYNVEIIEEQQSIIALGAGAVTKIVYPDKKQIKRIENVKNVENYIDRIEEMLKRKKEWN